MDRTLSNGWIMLAIGVLILGLICFGIFKYEEKKCRDQAHQMERGWNITVFAGCMVETNNGVYVPIENYRLTEEETDGGT